MKRGAKSKKAQFYLIAAIVIVFVVVSFAVVSNYIYVKEEPEKFYDIGEMIGQEGFQVVQQAVYSEEGTGTVNENIETYLELFESYLKEHPSENFNLVVIYGSIESEQVNVIQYYPTVNSGGVTLALGGTVSIAQTDLGQLSKDQTKISPNPPDFNTVNVTLVGGDKNITQQFPVLQDNNFVFMMTANDGFNQYVQSSLTPQTPGQ